MRPLIVAACLLSTAAFAAEPQIDPARITGHVKVLASDDFEGRAPASRAEPKVIDYIVSQFKQLGLEPAGDRQGSGNVNGSRAWTQDVPLQRSVFKAAPTVEALAAGKTLHWTQGEQVAIRAPATGIARLAVRNAPVVFAGYGVTAPERNWDDFKGIDLKGKIALVLVNDPDFETGSGDFGGKAMTYYGRWTYKYEEAARRGAVGFLVIHERDPASYGWVTVKNSNTNEIFDVVRPNAAAAHAPLEGWIQRDSTVELLRAAGLDFEALKKQAQTRDFRPVELKGVSLSIAGDVLVEKVVSHNIAAVLPGSKHPDERIIYTAHWDHLGVGEPDAKGDRIYNGAVDNADGIAALIEIARTFAAAPRPERSVMFLAVTAEEKGLLGSEYYADQPLYPLATTVANLNMDALAPTGPARDFGISGSAPLTLLDQLIAVARQNGKSFTPDPRPEAGHFFRSDHFSFAKRGVPAISYGSGEDLVTGGKAAGAAREEAYTRDRYHQPSDEIGPDWDSTGIAADALLLYRLGADLASSQTWPEWKDGAEFKAERDKTRAQRK